MDSTTKTFEPLSDRAETLHEHMGSLIFDDHTGWDEYWLCPSSYGNGFSLKLSDDDEPSQSDTPRQIDYYKYEIAIAEAISKLVVLDRKIIVKRLIDRL